MECGDPSGPVLSAQRHGLADGPWCPVGAGGHVLAPAGKDGRMPPGQVWESRDRGARFVGLQFCAALLEAGTPVAEAIPEGRHAGRTHHPLRTHFFALGEPCRKALWMALNA